MPTNARFAKASLWVNPDSLKKFFAGHGKILPSLYPSVNLNRPDLFHRQSSFRQDAAATDAKRRPGFQTSTLQRALPDKAAATSSRLRVNFCAALRRTLCLLFLILIRSASSSDSLLFGGVLAHVFRDLHGTEVWTAHGAEVRGLRAFLRKSFVVELAGGFGIERELN